MKKISRAATALLCAVVSVSVHADLSGTFKTITLDGSLADWSNPADVLYDAGEISAGAPLNSTYESVYVANDAANLYIGLDMAGTGGADINNTWLHNMFLDTDANGASGFNSGWMAHGYDRLIQYGAGGGSYSVFEFVGGSQGDWSWNWLGLVNYSYNDDIAEVSAPISMLGITGSTLVMELSVGGAGTTAETWAYQWESGAETYTLAVPEPATGSIVALFGGAFLYIRCKMMA